MLEGYRGWFRVMTFNPGSTSITSVLQGKGGNANDLGLGLFAYGLFVASKILLCYLMQFLMLIPKNQTSSI